MRPEKGEDLILASAFHPWLLGVVQPAWCFWNLVPPIYSASLTDSDTGQTTLMK